MSRVTQTIHVERYVYLHLVDFYGFLVGKYTIHSAFGFPGIMAGFESLKTDM